MKRWIEDGETNLIMKKKQTNKNDFDIEDDQRRPAQFPKALWSYVERDQRELVKERWRAYGRERLEECLKETTKIKYDL